MSARELSALVWLALTTDSPAPSSDVTERRKSVLTGTVGRTGLAGGATGMMLSHCDVAESSGVNSSGFLGSIG